MLKFFSELKVGQTFSLLQGGGMTFEMQADRTGKSLGAFKDAIINAHPDEVCTVEPGMAGDFESAIMQMAAPDTQVFAAGADYVDMAEADREGRIYILDPIGPENDGHRFVVIAPHSMERFDRVTVVDAWLVDELGHKTAESNPAPTPHFKEDFSDLAFFERDQSLIRRLYGTDGIIEMRKMFTKPEPVYVPGADRAVTLTLQRSDGGILSGQFDARGFLFKKGLIEVGPQGGAPSDMTHTVGACFILHQNGKPIEKVELSGDAWRILESARNAEALVQRVQQGQSLDAAFDVEDVPVLRRTYGWDVEAQLKNEKNAIDKPRTLSFEEETGVIWKLKTMGSFANHLGEALAAADSTNKKILTTAFWHLFSKLIPNDTHDISASKAAPIRSTPSSSAAPGR